MLRKIKMIILFLDLDQILFSFMMIRPKNCKNRTKKIS